MFLMFGVLWGSLIHTQCMLHHGLPNIYQLVLMQHHQILALTFVFPRIPWSSSA